MGRTTTYGYDAVGRLVTRTYPDTTTASFTYTPLGQRATATDARGVTRYTYDARNRLAALVYPDGRELDYGYDATGARTTLTAKIGMWSGTTTTTYDASGRATAIQDPAGRWTTLTHDSAGQRTALTYPNGVATTYGYDERGRVKTIDAVGSGSLQVTSFAYTLDAAGRRTRVDEALGTTRTYGYDSVDRLTSETATSAHSYVKTFTYDAVGNRLTQATTGTGTGTVNYAYDTRDRLLTENGVTYGYNANGDATSKSGEATYGWDYEDRLTTASMVGDGSVSHVYDVDGNRVKTTVSPSGGAATVTNLLVDPSAGLSHVVAETDGIGKLTALYVRAGDELLAVLRPTGATWSTRWVHSDALGSVRALTDEAGVAAELRGYEAFGTMNAQSGTDPLPYRFAGEPYDPTSKLAYHRARWMDARAGRFFGMDSWEGHDEAPSTLHRYLYASDNPVSLVDPTGKSSMVGVTVVMSIVAIGASMAVASPLHDFNNTGGGRFWANLRSRPVEGHESSRHLYIEYVDKSQGQRMVIVAKADMQTAHGSRWGYLHGFPPRAWETGINDSEAPKVKGDALERDSDDYSPLMGVNEGTLKCLEQRRDFWNSRRRVYDIPSPNSNTWAITICSECQLTYFALPDGYLPGSWGSL